jgi:hypothetical protein
VTDELRAKIEKIIEEDRETYQEIVTNSDIADKIAEVVDAEIVRALCMNTDFNETHDVTMGEILSAFDLEILAKRRSKI